MNNFKIEGIPEPLFHRLEQTGFKNPTPVQKQAIPLALKGHDILGSAQTGTGKTGAFGIPLVTNLMTTDKGSALVLLPTRELASQVLEALKKFIGSSKIKTALLIGGAPMPKQISQIKSGARLIVGTPGRINDHLDRKTLNLGNTKFLVLDEVDRMLDMGFGVQLDEIEKYLTSERQTLMFSATMPKNIKTLSAKYLKDPIRVTVGEAHKPAKNVKQEMVRVPISEKYTRLIDEIESREGTIIVFIKTKHAADKTAEKLKKIGHKAEALHGDLRQGKRNRVTQDYRAKKFRILIATDVAARGLDIPHIEHVINYDLPQSPEDYIHRIGRTARAGAEGEAISFLSGEDLEKWDAIQKLLDPSYRSNSSYSSKNNKSKNKKYGSRNGKKNNEGDSSRGSKKNGKKFVETKKGQSKKGKKNSASFKKISKPGGKKKR